MVLESPESLTDFAVTVPSEFAVPLTTTLSPGRTADRPLVTLLVAAAVEVSLTLVVAPEAVFTKIVLPETRMTVPAAMPELAVEPDPPPADPDAPAPKAAGRAERAADVDELPAS